MFGITGGKAVITAAADTVMSDYLRKSDWKDRGSRENSQLKCEDVISFLKAPSSFS